jgi:hypothetical protein
MDAEGVGVTWVYIPLESPLEGSIKPKAEYVMGGVKDDQNHMRCLGDDNSLILFDG